MTVVYLFVLSTREETKFLHGKESLHREQCLRMDGQEAGFRVSSFHMLEPPPRMLRFLEHWIELARFSSEANYLTQEDGALCRGPDWELDRALVQERTFLADFQVGLSPELNYSSSAVYFLSLWIYVWWITNLTKIFWRQNTYLLREGMQVNIIALYGNLFWDWNTCLQMQSAFLISLVFYFYVVYKFPHIKPKYPGCIWLLNIGN